MTTGLLTSSINKNKLLRQKLRNPTEDLKIKFRQYCSVYNKLKRLTKANYYNNILKETKDNIKRTWQITKHELPSAFMINNTLETDYRVIADELHKYFATIGKKLLTV